MVLGNTDSSIGSKTQVSYRSQVSKPKLPSIRKHLRVNPLDPKEGDEGTSLAARGRERVKNLCRSRTETEVNCERGGQPVWKLACSFRKNHGNSHGFRVG